MEQPAFIRYPWELLTHPELKPSDKIVLGVILYRIGQNGSCWPSQTSIAEDAGLSRLAVNRCVQRLQALGIVTAEREKRGRHQCLHYQLNVNYLYTKDGVNVKKAYIKCNKSLQGNVTKVYTELDKGELDTKNKELGVLRVPTNLTESANGHPKKIHPTQELRAPTRRESTKPTNPNPNGWMSRPHAEQIRALLTHFNDTLPGKPLEAIEAMQSAAAAFDTLLRQFKTPDEGLERLSAIITWVATCKQSRYWVGRVTSPRCLLPLKDGQPLWKRAEVEMLADREYQAEHEEDNPSIPTVREMRIKHGLSPV